MKYFDELKRSMEYLASDSRTIFIGQAVAVPGTAMSNTLTDIASEKLIELPVAEEMQMGMSLGMGGSDQPILLSRSPIEAKPHRIDIGKTGVLP